MGKLSNPSLAPKRSEEKGVRPGSRLEGKARNVGIKPVKKAPRKNKKQA